ncbi:MAG: hypothetical protein N3B12_00990 [Armatimonadetes bacterium]|nr:hypothetical protein [Armatimonadota bacterium]
MRLLLLVAVFILGLVGSRSNGLAGEWETDIRHQPLSVRPRIEARYTDAARTAFTIEAQNYRIVADLKSGSGQRIRSLAVRGMKGFAEVLTANGAYLELVDGDGVRYTSLSATQASRINIYRRGPYYIETHWLDVQLADSSGRVAPVKAEVVFYSYPEKTHVGVILHVTGPIVVRNASMIFEFDAEGCASPAERGSRDGVRICDFVIIKRAGDAPSCALVYPVPKGIDDIALERLENLVRAANSVYSSDAHDGAIITWKEGDKPSAYFEIFPLESSEVSEALESEIQPILSTNITASAGRVRGYDPVRGCYTIQTDNAGGFSYHYYENPNHYEIAKFAIQNGPSPRKIYVLHETRANPGYVECGVLLDKAGLTLPIMVQISKNFAGENEEPFYDPGDPPFSETIFPLYLEPGEHCELTSLHLYQNWGSHPLKQFSSLRAWMDYYHMSTGVTETTCYVPFMFGGLDGVAIADLRPMSQPMWESQPQHDNVAGHSFLRYRDEHGKWHYIEYVGTTFRSTGPNWADVSFDYLSDDGKVKVRLDVFELPQSDELRNFVRMRVDFIDSIKISDGDLARNLRLLNIASWVQQMRYTHVAYGGPTGEPTVATIKLNDDFTIAGVPLPTENGFATIYPDKKGANAFVVRRFTGTLGGEPVGPGVSVIGQKNGDTVLILVPVTKAREVKAGDWIETDFFFMPYGGGTQDWLPVRKAAFDYGLNAPRITGVKVGTKIEDFPTRIRLDDNGAAEFTLVGGFDVIPIIVEGAKDYVCQRLYVLEDSSKTLVDHARTGERDGYQVFAKEDGTFGWVFLVKTDGKERRYRIE